MRPAANPIQRAAQEIDLDITRKEREVGKLRAARTVLEEILADMGLNRRTRVVLKRKAAKKKRG